MSGGRREQILDAAREISRQRGMGAVTVRAVATRAGIGASTLRHYFPSQRELYAAVVDDALDAQLDDHRIADASIPAAKRLTECLAQILPADASQVPLLQAWFAGHAHAVGPGRTDEGARVLEALTRRARVRLDGWLATLDGEGALRHGDRERHADVLLAVLDGLSLQLLTAAIDVPTAHAVLADVTHTTVVRTS